LTQGPRISNFVFYSGDPRLSAKAYVGCHRDLILGPLMNHSRIDDDKTRTTTTTTSSSLSASTGEANLLMDVRIVSKGKRLSQQAYNHRMITSDYCLILCGDTPSSRSLTSAIVSGCIPLFIGSRWRGLCDPPCVAKFGFVVTGIDNPHYPYRDLIPWDQFPELDEERFVDGHGIEDLIQLFQNVNDERKNHLRSIMDSTRNGWIYGWGDPWTSDRFGEATTYIWESFLRSFQQYEENLQKTQR